MNQSCNPYTLLVCLFSPLSSTEFISDYFRCLKGWTLWSCFLETVSTFLDFSEIHLKISISVAQPVSWNYTSLVIDTFICVVLPSING